MQVKNNFLCMACLLAFLVGFTPASLIRLLFQQDIHYKLRDGNRWEGVKIKRWKPVSGTLELASLLIYSDTRQQNLSVVNKDSVTIYFCTPDSSIPTVSVFELDKKYFMDPEQGNFGNVGMNSFSWPAQILSTLRLPIIRLKGLSKARVGGTEIFYPLYFTPPEDLRDRLELEISLFPARDMMTDVSLYNAHSDTPIKTWPDIQMKSDRLKPLYWRMSAILTENADFYLVAEEKPGKRKHTFKITISKL